MNTSHLCHPHPLDGWTEADVRALVRAGSAYVVSYAMNATRDAFVCNGLESSIPRELTDKLKRSGDLVLSVGRGNGYGAHYVPPVVALAEPDWRQQ